MIQKLCDGIKNADNRVWSFSYLLFLIILSEGMGPKE